MMGISASRLALAAACALAAAPALAQQTITWVTHPAILEATGNGAVIRECEAQGGINVDVQTFPGASLQQKIMTELVAGSGGYDVISLNDNTFTQDVVRFVEPIGDYARKSPLPDGGLSDFSPGFVQQYAIPQTADGALYGVPNRMSIDILYYRKDLLDKYGIAVPRTLEEYLAAARKLKAGFAKDGMTGIFPATLQGNVEFGVLDWYDWVSALGGDMLTAPDWKTSELKSKAAIEATKLRRQFIEEGLASPAVVNYGFDDAVNAMAQGSAAMTIMYSAYWPRLEDASRSKVAGKIGYAAAPRSPDVDLAHFGRGWALFIPKASKKKEAAWEFIRCITNEKSQLSMALDYGNAATRLSVVSNPAYAAKVPVADALAKGLPHAKIMPNIPRLRKIYDEIGTQLTRALSGEISAEQAMREADAKVEPLLPRQ